MSDFKTCRLVHTIRDGQVKAQIFVCAWPIPSNFRAELHIGTKCVRHFESNSYTDLVNHMVELVADTADEGYFVGMGWMPGLPAPRFTAAARAPRV